MSKRPLYLRALNRLYAANFATTAARVLSRAIPAAVVTVAVLAGAVGADAHAAVNGRIAYMSENQGSTDIYTIQPDGSDRINLTNDPAIDITPAFSKGGDRIAFASMRRFGINDFEIFAMKAGDGSDISRLTANSGSDTSPAWSGDDSSIFFRSMRNGLPNHLYSIGVGGTGPQLLTGNSGLSAHFSPHTSTDSRKVVFFAYVGTNADIYTVDTDGGNLRRITTDTSSDTNPEFSPDGKTIAFASTRNGYINGNVYTVPADGGSVKRLTYTPSSTGNYDPSWSPDGKKIAFTSNDGNHLDIYTIDADSGGNRFNVTRTTDRIEVMPSWGMGEEPPITPRERDKNRSETLGTGSCERVAYTNRLQAPREVMLKDLWREKGVKVFASASEPSSGQIQIEIEGRKARWFKLYRRTSKDKSKVLARKGLTLDEKPRAIYLKVRGKRRRLIKRALRFKGVPDRTKLKVTLVSSAVANKQLKRINTQTIRALRRGETDRTDRYEKVRHVIDRSACDEPLVAQIKGPRQLKLSSFVNRSGKKRNRGLKVVVSCSQNCTARVGFRLWGRYEIVELKFRSKGQKKNRWITSRKVKLKAGQKKTLLLAGPGKKRLLKLLAGAASKKRYDRVKVKYAIKARTSDGQADAKAGTTRVQLIF